MKQGNGWAIVKSDVPFNLKRSAVEDYPFHDRAVMVYNQYISGFTEEEIVVFLNRSGEECDLTDIECDLQHIKSLHPTRALIAHENDRNRLLLQRTEGKQYRRLLGESLSIEAKQFLAAGINPTATLKEFREAVGMTEKPGSFQVNVNQQSLNIGGGEARQQTGIRSSEDLLRAVMDKMNAANSQNQIPQSSDVVIEASPSEEAAPIDGMIDIDEEEEDFIPDPDS
jgi:hypothetical protein